nr:chromatin target of PRMT1 protein [Ciona intestinalis]XP_009860745.1 chromatin target of PRMT1 protein [Ciona intestinalis]|eukprot:XP_002127341.3 chromatin target of PRMT1 protein [Ciona intestinalis]
MAESNLQKITFKNTTKMSLNARFTTIMKSRPPPTAQTVRAQTSTDRMASDKNRRLAQQMERRPAVEAALGHSKPQTPQASTPPKLSVRERLGHVRGRGGLNSSQNGGFRSATTSRARGTFSRGRGSVRGRVLTSPLSGRITKSVRGNFRGRARGAFRGSRGRGASVGRGGKIIKKEVSKDALDNDLDSYMSKTRGSMDAELDEYMANHI